MMPSQFRNEMVQYACAALEGMLANRDISQNLRGNKDQVCQAAWEYAQSMAEVALSEADVGALRKKIESGNSAR